MTHLLTHLPSWQAVQAEEVLFWSNSQAKRQRDGPCRSGSEWLGLLLYSCLHCSICAAFISCALCFSHSGSSFITMWGSRWLARSTSPYMSVSRQTSVHTFAIWFIQKQNNILELDVLWHHFLFSLTFPQMRAHCCWLKLPTYHRQLQATDSPPQSSRVPQQMHNGKTDETLSTRVRDGFTSSREWRWCTAHFLLTNCT